MIVVIRNFCPHCQDPGTWGPSAKEQKAAEETAPHQCRWPETHDDPCVLGVAAADLAKLLW